MLCKHEVVGSIPSGSTKHLGETALGSQEKNKFAAAFVTRRWVYEIVNFEGSSVRASAVGRDAGWTLTLSSAFGATARPYVSGSFFGAWRSPHRA